MIARFGLVPLEAEGGFVNRYWPSADDTEVAPGSAILFLVTDAPEGCSQFHRLTIDEIWHRYLGDPAELVLLEPGGDEPPRHARRRPRRRPRARPRRAAPATWMACRTTGRWSLLGTTMAPGFTPGCFEDGDRRRPASPAGRTRRPPSPP